MNSRMKIKALIDCPELIPQLADLWYERIGKIWAPHIKPEQAQQRFLTHCNREQLPIMYVAIENNNPVGMVALRQNDGIRTELCPWLAGLVVRPDYQKHGLGRNLIEFVKAQAKTLGHDKLYLLTFDSTLPNWYAKLGWKEFAKDTLFDKSISLMEIEI